MNVLFWPVHGGYSDSFLRGDHDYLLPVDRAAEQGGLGLPEAHRPRVRAVDEVDLAFHEVDVIVLQRVEEIALVEELTGMVPGLDVPAVYLEHNAPRPWAVQSRHPLAERPHIPIVHVTHFNRLFWDSGEARTTVVEHGVPDRGAQYSGELPRVAAVINEPVRRGRVTGTDLLPALAEEGPIDVFGIDADALDGPAEHRGFGVHPAGDLPTALLHQRLAAHRLYLHPYRWTSLGLALLEAMMLGMPVVAVAATEVGRAVPPGAGVVSDHLEELRLGIRGYLGDLDLARAAGAAARAHVLEHHGLARFLARWDEVLGETVDLHRARSRGRRSVDLGAIGHGRSV